MKNKTFMTLYVEGKISEKDIDNYIELWHNMKNDRIMIYDYLGMTEEEYAQWVRDPSVLSSFKR